MTKTEFLELVQTEGAYSSKAEAKRAVDAFTGAIEKALAKTFVGFGTFSAQFQKGKTGKVPGTDKTYTTQDRYVPKFKPGKNLKETVGGI